MSLSSLSRESGGNSLSSERKESIERIVNSETSVNNVNSLGSLGGVATSISDGVFPFFAATLSFKSGMRYR